MNEAVVLDASALLALLLGEPGGERVKDILDGALVCAVNLAEIVSYFAKLGSGREDISAIFRPMPIRIVSVDVGLSYDAGMMRPLTVRCGLSLGDRYCLALARREGASAITAERRWQDIAEDVGVPVELIR